jgi:hypothetical protein
MLNHSPIEHARRNMPAPALLLQGMETLENDTFTLAKTISDVWYIVMRVTMVHL